MDYLEKLKIRKKLMSMLPLAVLCTFFFVFLLFSVPAFNPQLFRGYYTLYYQGELSEKEFSEAIASDPGIETVISSSSAKVAVTNLNSTEYINIAQLEKRFEPDDPRYDNYMKQLYRYFIIKEDNSTWNIFYIKTQQNALYLSMILSRIIGQKQIEWHIYEQELSEIVIIVSIAGTAFILLLLLLYKNNFYRLLLILGVLPWISALVSGGIMLFILFFIIAYIWALFLKEFLIFIEGRFQFEWEDPDTKKLAVTLCIYAGLILTVIVLGVFLRTIIQNFFIAIGVQAIILSTVIGYNIFYSKVNKKGKFRKKYFSPVSIVGIFTPDWRKNKAKKYIRLSIFLIIALIPVILMLPGSTPHKNLPVPDQLHGEADGISLTTIKSLAGSDNTDSLPDLYDFAVHRSYQERLSYGKYSYTFPEENEEISVSSFITNQRGQIEKNQETVKRFDESWFSDVKNQLYPESVERLLFDQQVPVTVNFKETRSQDHEFNSVWTIILNWCILLCPLLFLNNQFTFNYIFGVKKDIQILIRELK